MRNHSHFGGPPADYQSWPYATDAATALRQLDDAYDKWIAGVRALDDDELDRPCGPAEGPYADYPFSDADPAHQPRDDSPRRRNRLHPRPLREQPREEGEVANARNAPTRQGRTPDAARVPAVQPERLLRGGLRPDRRAGAVEAVGERAVDRRADQARRRCAARLDGPRQGGARVPAPRRAAVRGAGRPNTRTST